MTHARRGVRSRGLVIIRAWFVSERISVWPLTFFARETTDHSVGVVPICLVFGPPFYITRCCPFTLRERATIELYKVSSSVDTLPDHPRLSLRSLF